jgi:hypothetical protein
MIGICIAPELIPSQCYPTPPKTYSIPSIDTQKTSTAMEQHENRHNDVRLLGQEAKVINDDQRYHSSL